MRLSLPGNRGNLYYSCIAANLASLAIGTHYSWTSPTIPKLEEADSWLRVNTEQASWIVALVSLGTAFGPFLGGWLVNSIGRRWAMMCSVIMTLIAWAILLVSSSIWMVYFGRLLAGVGGGISFLACPMYVAEVSEVEVRGALGSLFAFFLVGGYLVEYVVGPFVSYSTLIIVNCIPSILFFVIFSVTPESPYYYLCKDRVSDALESLTWLRTGRSPEEVQRELTEMQTEVLRSMSEKAKLTDLIGTRGNRRGLLISCGMVAGQQFSGVNVVLFYAQTIFIMAGTSFSPSGSTIIIGIMLFLSGGMAAPLARAFGMKNMFIFSAIGMTIFQLLLGLFFYFSSETSYNMSSFGWLPVTSLVGYILCYAVGFGPLPWAVMAEVFPSNMKAPASAITASFCWFIGFLLTKFFSNISSVLGNYVPFFLFSAFCLAALFYTIFMLPDTRGMTLQEILDLLNKDPSTNSSGKKQQTPNV